MENLLHISTAPKVQTSIFVLDGALAMACILVPVAVEDHYTRPVVEGRVVLLQWGENAHVSKVHGGGEVSSGAVVSFGSAITVL